MRIAYMVLAHQDSTHLARLVRAIHHDDDRTFIHLDAKADASAFASACGDQAHFVELRFPVYWGGFNMVAVTLGMLRRAAAVRPRFDRFILLSGADYPIRGRRFIHDRLTEDAEFIDAFPLPGDCWLTQRGGLDRIEQFHFLDSKWTNPKTRSQVHPRVRSVIDRLGGLKRRLPARKLPAGLAPWGGGQWWNLTHAAVEHVLQTLDGSPRLVRFFRYTYAPDELLFQTILMNSPLAGKVRRDCLRYIDWSREDPAVLDTRDKDRLRASPALFARKFVTGRSDALLDRIDSWRQAQDA